MLRPKQTAEYVVSKSRGLMCRERALCTPSEEIDLVFSSSPRNGTAWINPQLSAVYVVSNSVNGLVKIGHADNLKHRFSGLNTGSPVDLHLRHFVYLVGGLIAKAVEAETHSRLAAHRKRGEWFEVDAHTAARMIASVVIDRKLIWWTESERRQLGKDAAHAYAQRIARNNFFLRN